MDTPKARYRTLQDTAHIIICLTKAATVRHIIHMRRTNLVLDEVLLDDARKALGFKTYSEVVNVALRELLRRTTFAGIDRYAHSGIWEGDLAEMRGDDVVPG